MFRPKPLFFAILLTALSFNISAQSRRVNPAAAKTPVEAATIDPAAVLSVKEMFDEANAYYRVKITEFEQKKTPYSDALNLQTRREQKQLAAKYAGIVRSRTDMSAEDFYYLGRLEWIAENMDGARENLLKFLSSANPETDKAQNSRSVIVVITARKKNFDESEKLLSDYVKVGPVKQSERSYMESELANAYMSEKNYAKAAVHAKESYTAKKALAGDPAAKTTAVDDTLEAGLLLFEAYRASNNYKEADSTLEELRAAAVQFQSPVFFYYAVDAQIKYQIETGRKAAALENYAASLKQAESDLTNKAAQANAVQRLKKREKHYRLLGETAPELVNIDQVFPGEQKPLGDFRGKVVLLDFWATWCTPCLEAFPSMLEWQQDFGRDGFIILGLTRYYGEAEGFPVDKQSEVNFLKRFKRAYALPYDFLVAKDESNHKNYGAAAIPTAVLIDRKGIIRYIESGTSKNRLEELREMIAKLVAEK